MHRLPLLSLVLLVGCASNDGVTSMGRTGGAIPALMVNSEVIGSTGDPIGTASLRQEADGVRVMLSLTGLPQGSYAVHLHAVGRCDTPAFTSAGPHFNPAMKQHGSLNPMGEHAGDLPNIEVDANRRGGLDAMRPGLRLVDGPAALIDADGAAILVHAAPDDYKTDPAGNAGARIACGVITSGK